MCPGEDETLLNLRLLHVVPSFYPAVVYGGPIFSVLHLCRNLRELGCDLRILTTDANGRRRLTAEEQSSPALSDLSVKFSRRIGFGMIAPALLRSIVTEARTADIIHLTAVYNFPTFPALMTARLLNKPLVWSPRGTLQRWAGSRRVGPKATWEGICRVLRPEQVLLHATSDEEAAESSPRLGNPAIAVVPNGVEIPLEYPPPPADGQLKLLFLGRIDPKKGLENLITAVSRLGGQSLQNWQLTVAGHGAAGYVDSLRRLAGSLDVTERVKFVGHLDGQDKTMAFRSCDVFLAPSFTENFGLTIAEALAHGRPVIASRGTPWSGIDKYNCGLWVPNDPDSLASAILQLRDADRIAMGLRGRRWMIQEFSWRERARKMISHYQTMLAP